MAGNHATLSPSGADRWMLCPGSAAMEQGLHDESSAYADEGTAAHFLASEALLSGKNASHYIGKSIVVSADGASWKLHPVTDDEEVRVFEIDDDMISAVQVYLDLVRELVASTGGALMVEQRLSIAHLTGEEDAAGTSDTVILTPEELIVVDLKYGMGHRVYADDNRQLKVYALAALEEFSILHDFKRARLIISQPRITSAPSEWPVSIEDLLAFADEVKACAEKATFVATKVAPDEFSDYLTPGYAQCKWCKAKAQCVALNAYIQDTIGAGFDDLTEIETELPSVTEMAKLSPTEVGDRLARVHLVESWCKAIRGHAEALLFEHNNSEEIMAQLGYKLVQGKRGNRQWRDKEAAEETFKRLRVKKEDMYDFKLISPTTAEKRAKEGVIGPRQWPKIVEMITQAEGKPSVAPLIDKRPALIIAPTADTFDAVGDDDESLV